MGFLGFSGIDIEDAPDDVVPRCPACREQLTRVWVKEQGILGSGQRILLCPHCRTWLGYATTRE